MNKEETNRLIDLVNEKLMNLGAPEVDANLDTKTIFAKGLFARDFGIKEWDWPQGVGLYGFLQLQKARHCTDYDAFLKQWVEDNLAIGLPSRNINTTAPFLVLLDLTERYDLPEWEAMCKEHAEWLMNSLPRTEDDGFQHVTTGINGRNSVRLNTGELWDDTLFMAVLFLGKMGVRYQNRAWIEESVYQFLVHIEYLYEKKVGLLYHGWTFIDNNNFGGIFWNRGNSWFTYGAIAYLETMGDTIAPSARRYILNVWTHQVKALQKLQADNGLWHTILDDASTYEEVSGSAAITAGVLLGIRRGMLDPSFREMGMKAVEGLTANIAEDGTVQNVSSGTAMGMDAEHYKHISIMPMAYGQSLCSLALTEALYFMD